MNKNKKKNKKKIKKKLKKNIIPKFNLIKKYIQKIIVYTFSNNIIINIKI